MQEKLKNMDFRDAFRASTHTQEIGNKSIAYTFMESEKATDKPAVCFVPGLGFRYTAYEKSLETLHASGRSFCAFGYVEAGLPMPSAAQEWIDKKLVTAEQAQRAVGFIAMIRSLHDSVHPPVDIIAHSMGALSAILAAALEPELFRSLVLYAPAGFIEHDSVERVEYGTMSMASLRNQLLVSRADRAGEHARDFLTRAVGDWASFSMQNFLNFPSLVRGVASAYVPSIAKSALDAGVFIFVELGGRDGLFPAHLLKPALEKYKIPYVIHDDADHNTIGTEASMMRELEQRSSGSAGGIGKMRVFQ